MSLDLAAIRAAHGRIRPHIVRTPVLTNPALDAAWELLPDVTLAERDGGMIAAIRRRSRSYRWCNETLVIDLRFSFDGALLDRDSAVVHVSLFRWHQLRRRGTRRPLLW